MDLHCSLIDLLLGVLFLHRACHLFSSTLSTLLSVCWFGALEVVHILHVWEFFVGEIMSRMKLMSFGVWCRWVVDSDGIFV